VELDYTDEEWADSGAPGALASMAPAELIVLHRQWMWANQQRERFDELLSASSPDDRGNFASLVSKDAGHMLAWYGLLWSVIEAFAERGITFSGRFGADIAAISDDLRRLRNAVFHVPKAATTTHDSRLVAFVARPDSVELVGRVHRGFGRLFLIELRERNAAARQEPAGHPEGDPTGGPG